MRPPKRQRPAVMGPGAGIDEHIGRGAHPHYSGLSAEERLARYLAKPKYPASRTAVPWKEQVRFAAHETGHVIAFASERLPVREARVARRVFHDGTLGYVRGPFYAEHEARVMQKAGLLHTIIPHVGGWAGELCAGFTPDEHSCYEHYDFLLMTTHPDNKQPLKDAWPGACLEAQRRFAAAATDFISIMEALLERGRLVERELRELLEPVYERAGGVLSREQIFREYMEW